MFDVTSKCGKCDVENVLPHPTTVSRHVKGRAQALQASMAMKVKPNIDMPSQQLYGLRIIRKRHSIQHNLLRKQLRYDDRHCPSKSTQAKADNFSASNRANQSVLRQSRMIEPKAFVIV